MAERSSIFDMIGPVMIGPSSSHTAGVVKIGLVAHHLLGGAPESAVITFYNSFARTYEGHGSDRAIVGGLMGFPTDDNRLKHSLDLAKEAGIQLTFRPVGSASTMHPNTVKVNLTRHDRTLEMVGVSKGGGVILIEEVNGFTANFSGTLHTLIVLAEDVKGTIAFISNILANDDCNIATMSVSRKGKNDLACQFIEVDSDIRQLTLEYLRSLRWVKEVHLIPPVGGV
jgi:L-serine dehydratase